MTVMKTKDMDWRKYLNELKNSTFKMSDVERQEFTGYLLRHDMAEKENCMDIFSSILMNHNVMLADLIAEVLINESPETIGILIQNIKNIVTDFYQETIESLLNSQS